MNLVDELRLEYALCACARKFASYYIIVEYVRGVCKIIYNQQTKQTLRLV